jgi:hypothetical protein
LLPEGGVGIGWSCARRQRASAIDVLLDLLQIGQGKQVREERRVIGKEVGERKEARVHRRRRIHPGKLAGLRTFGDEFHRFWRCFAREEKRRRGRRCRAIYIWL